MRVKVTNIKLYRTRNGQEMAFIEAYHRYTIVIMPTLYLQVKELLIIGHLIDLQGFNTQGKIIATQIKPIPLPVISPNNLVLA